MNKKLKHFSWFNSAAGATLLLGSLSPAVTQATPLSPIFLSNSSWQEDKNCQGQEYMAFIDDKTARDSSGVMNYTIAGAENLVFSNNGNSLLMQAKVIDGSTMVVTIKGNTGLIYRCGQASNVAQNSGNTAAQVVAGLAILGGLAALASSSSPAAPILSPTMLEGKWTESNNCASDFTLFLASGRFNNSNGGVGNWSLSGDNLTLAVDVSGSAFQTPVFANLQATSYDSITLTSSGQTSYMQRCP